MYEKNTKKQKSEKSELNHPPIAEFFSILSCGDKGTIITLTKNPVNKTKHVVRMNQKNRTRQFDPENHSIDVLQFSMTMIFFYFK